MSIHPLIITNKSQVLEILRWNLHPFNCSPKPNPKPFPWPFSDLCPVKHISFNSKIPSTFSKFSQLSIFSNVLPSCNPQSQILPDLQLSLWYMTHSHLTTSNRLLFLLNFFYCVTHQSKVVILSLEMYHQSTQVLMLSSKAVPTGGPYRIRSNWTIPNIIP